MNARLGPGLTCVCITLASLLWFSALAVRAADRYVSPPGGYGTNDTAGGYTNWLGAATNIQWAVNKAAVGEAVWVTNGTYALTNEISITNVIVVVGLNGREKTFISGNYPAYTNRCFNIRTNAVIDGFTISNGFAVYEGGGVYLTGGGTLQNCTISGNMVSNSVTTGSGRGGGGVKVASPGYVYNCNICFNSVKSGIQGWYGEVGGGGIYLSGGVVSNCAIFTNTVSGAGGVQPGGGVFSSYGTVLNCMIYSNYCAGRGGGIYARDGGSLKKSSIYKNSSVDDGRGIYVAGPVTTESCLVYENTASSARFDDNAIIRNCTIVNNPGNGISTYSTSVGPTFENTVSYYSGTANIARSGTAFPTFTNCCAGPDASTITALANGIGNITNAPLFVNTNAGNYRLANNSPCVNRGTNRTWMTGAVDLDGRMRIRYGTVDMGAYERIHEGAIFGFR